MKWSVAFRILNSNSMDPSSPPSSPLRGTAGLPSLHRQNRLLKFYLKNGIFKVSYENQTSTLNPPSKNHSRHCGKCKNRGSPSHRDSVDVFNENRGYDGHNSANFRTGKR